MSDYSGKNLLSSVKAAAGRPGPQLSLSTPHHLTLRPVATQVELQSRSDVQVLTDWRNKYVDAFLNEFEATEPQTSRWLAEMTGPRDDNILFMVDNEEGVTCGYMGIGYIDWQNSYGEADAIVRGLPLPKGSMMAALHALIKWGKGQLGIKTFGVRVRSDNSALDFYRKCGFIEQKRIALLKTEHENGVTYVPQEDAEVTQEPSLVHMILE